MKAPQLYFFEQGEFLREDKYANPMNWFDHMNPRLLVILDILRYQWALHKRREARILISPHPKAIGRQMGKGKLSDHNIDHWGEVNGIDIFPEFLSGVKDVEAFRDFAVLATATAIGFYPHWKPQAGFHIGCRPDRKPGNPALWGFIGRPQRLVSFNEALEAYT